MNGGPFIHCGIRLLYATCKKFYEYCLNHNIELSDSRFTITYNTNIPRQVGLGGSSAIIGALTKALMEFHNISYDIIPKPMLPNFLLSVEEDELQIRAGLQDRVIQVYGGVVYMDFSRELMEMQGHGKYEYIDSQLVPSLFVAYTSHPSGESGRFHNPIRFRFEQGDKQVIDAMKTFADYVRFAQQFSFAKPPQQARDALLNRDYETFGELMNKNFNLRRNLYGDNAIGAKNLQMIQIACSHGFPAKFCGSGGAVVGMLENPDSSGYKTDEPQDEVVGERSEQFEPLRKCYRDKGFECIKACPRTK